MGVLKVLVPLKEPEPLSEPDELVYDVFQIPHEDPLLWFIQNGFIEGGHTVTVRVLVTTVVSSVL